MRALRDYRLWLIALWLASRCWLLAVGLAAPAAIAPESGLAPSSDRVMALFDRFDAMRYIQIADRGYFMSAQGPGGWFPGYPLLMRVLSPLDDPLLAGVLVSNLSFLGALFCLYHLVRLDLDEAAMRRVLMLVLVFPSAFLSSCVYSEASFLLFTSASVLAVRKGYWKGAVALACGAALIRPQGCLLAPLLLWEYWQQRGRVTLDIAWLALVPSVVLGFFFFLQVRLGYFLTYVYIQRELGLQLGVGATLSAHRHLLLEQKVGLAFLLLELGLLLWGWKRMRPGYRAYIVLAMAMALAHTQGLCSHRFMWVLFPLYYAPAERLSGRATLVVLTLSLGLQALLFGLWVQGYRTTY